MKRSVLPLALVLIAAPFFANYREEPAKFGILQGILVVAITIAASGGMEGFRKKMRTPVFAAFWVLLVGAVIAAPFLVQFLKF